MTSAGSPPGSGRTSAASPPPRETSGTLSYGYAVPYGQGESVDYIPAQPKFGLSLTMSVEPGYAIAADQGRGSWESNNRPFGDQTLNSTAHGQGEQIPGSSFNAGAGQNVLFIDGSNQFTTQSDVGARRPNGAADAIYNGFEHPRGRRRQHHPSDPRVLRPGSEAASGRSEKSFNASVPRGPRPGPGGDAPGSPRRR